MRRRILERLSPYFLLQFPNLFRSAPPLIFEKAWTSEEHVGCITTKALQSEVYSGFVFSLEPFLENYFICRPNCYRNYFLSL